MSDYDHTNETAFSADDCRAAVGRAATLTLTGTITEVIESASGSGVKFAVDERWGFGGFVLGIDLDALNVVEA